MVTLHIILNEDERKPGGINQADHISICSFPDGVEGLEGQQDCEIWFQRQHQNPEIQLHIETKEASVLEFKAITMNET